MKTPVFFCIIVGASAHIACRVSFCFGLKRCRNSNVFSSPTRTSLCMTSWEQFWQDATAVLGAKSNATTKAKQTSQSVVPQDEASMSVATVVRMASRKYHATSSKPSSRNYTTRKDAQSSLKVTKGGVEGDYNHYRTTALKSTPNRALSILTQDVMDFLRSTSYPEVLDGDLGENVLLKGVPYTYFQIGQQYQFQNNDNNVVIVEITEPIVPCANLCKLPSVNSDKLAPNERIAKCQDFIKLLEDRGDGFRGWYAKIVQEGVVSIGDELSIADKKKQ